MLYWALPSDPFQIRGGVNGETVWLELQLRGLHV